MKSRTKKIGIFIVVSSIFLFSLFFGRNIVSADTPSPSPSPSSGPSSCVTTVQACLDNNITSCSDCVNYLNSQISEKQGQEKTLSSQIAVMDSQISLTEARIEATQEQITSLTLDIDTASKKISSLETSLNGLVNILANRIVATYEVGTIQPLQILLTSGNAADFFTRLNYLKIAQAHDKELIYNTEQAKVDYSNQKNILEEEKKKVVALEAQLQAYSDQLNQEKAAKQDLLTQTQGSESTYQSLLAQAQAQLAGFSRFVTSQGGASILGNQTTCDSWGCYYNQRDSQWGNMLINGQAGYTMAGYGCLITSIAMMASHMGHTDILPSDIAQSGGSNFAVDTAMLRYNISIKGVNINRSDQGSTESVLDSNLQNGPVIVGIYAYGGTHFVVIKSGSGGNYTMDDPFIAGGHDISFTDHYSTSSIFEIDTVSM